MISVTKKVKLDNMIVTETSSLDRMVREVLSEYMSLLKSKVNNGISMPRQNCLSGLSPVAETRWELDWYDYSSELKK